METIIRLGIAVALVAGCPAAGARAATSDQGAATMTTPAWETTTIRTAIMYRDGGTLVLTGTAGAGTAVRVRWDGKYGSPTRGTWFVTVDAGHERRLTPAEAALLLPAVERALADPHAALDAKVLKPVHTKLAAFAGTATGD